MHVAITGGTGFIGKRLVAAHLAAGDRVRVLTRRATVDQVLPAAVEMVQGSLGAGSIPPDFFAGIDVFYHCAAELKDAPRMQATNVEGTRQLASAATGHIRRWVQLSSVGVFGPVRAGEVTEESSFAPSNPYEVSKLAADRLVEEAAARGAFELVTLRPSIVFGASMPNRSLAQLAQAVRRGLFFYVGAPGASANYVHVDGVVDALVRCARTPAAAGRSYVLSDYLPVESFIGAMADALNVRAPRRRVPEWVVRGLARATSRLPKNPLTEGRVDALTTRVTYPSRRIAAELGYVHPVSLVDGIAELVRAGQK